MEYLPGKCYGCLLTHGRLFFLSVPEEILQLKAEICELMEVDRSAVLSQRLELCEQIRSTRRQGKERKRVMKFLRIWQ